MRLVLSPGLTLLLALALPSTWQARGAVTISGSVYDSVAHAPLAGAIVQVARVDSATVAAPRTFTAITDSAGRYVVEDIPKGRFAIGFQHDALSALGLEAPIRALEILGDRAIAIDLYVPSGRVIRALRCGANGSGRDGMLAGYVTGARNGAVRAMASIEVFWTEMVVKDGKMETVRQSVRARVGEAGNYTVCGLPLEETLDVRVSDARYRSIDGALLVPPGGVIRRDFALADSTSVTGTSRIVGRVLTSDSTPLQAGRATIASLGTEASVSAGRFSIGGVPAGTWPIEIRAIGYEPHRVLVNLTEGATTTATIVVSRRTQILDAVSIVGKPGRDLVVLSALRQRMRVSGGTAFMPGNSWLETATFPADVVRAARGFTYKSPTMVYGRPQAGGGACVSSSAPRREGDGKRVVIYLDGMKFPAGLEELQNLVPMKQVLAIEAYPDILFAPAQWRTNDACAVIAFWTKR